MANFLLPCLRNGQETPAQRPCTHGIAGTATFLNLAMEFWILIQVLNLISLNLFRSLAHFCLSKARKLHHYSNARIKPFFLFFARCTQQIIIPAGTANDFTTWTSSLTRTNFSGISSYPGTIQFTWFRCRDGGWQVWVPGWPCHCADSGISYVSLFRYSVWTRAEEWMVLHRRLLILSYRQWQLHAGHDQP